MFYTKASWPNMQLQYCIYDVTWVHDVAHKHKCKSDDQYVHAIRCYTSVVAELWRNCNMHIQIPRTVYYSCGCCKLE